MKTKINTRSGFRFLQLTTHNPQLITILTFLIFQFFNFSIFQSFTVAQQCAIGTTALSGTLNIEGPNAKCGIDINNTNATDGDALIKHKLRGTVLYTMGCDDSDADMFKIGTTAPEVNTRFSIKSDGNVGFGYAGCPTKCGVLGADATRDEMIIENTSTGDPVIGWMTNATRRITCGVDNSDGDKFKWGTTDINTANWMIWTSAGNVGVGPVDPNAVFQVSKTNAAAEVQLVRNDATVINAEVMGGLDFSDNDGLIGANGNNVTCNIEGVASTTHATTDKGGRLRFQTSPLGKDQDVALSLRMTIASFGNVGIGALPSASFILTVNGISRSTVADWATSSDKRVKENIKDIKNASQILMKLRPVTFDWKEEYLQHHPGITKESIGFIAQEVEKVMPEMVNVGETEELGDTKLKKFHTLNTSAITPLLVSAIKEDQTKINQNGNDLSNLKITTDELNNRLYLLETQTAGIKYKATETVMK